MQDGTVRLDQPLSAFVPGAPDLTLESLATHHSGLPRLLPGNVRAIRRAPDSRDPYAAEDEPTVLAALRRTRLRRRRYTYSNHGFGLLGLALSKATGRSYGELVHALLAEPLGLTTVTMQDPPGLALPHVKDRTVPVWHFPEAVAGCGGARGSVQDLARWLGAALGDVPEPLSSALTMATAARARAKGGQVGLGWNVGLPFVKGREGVLWHNGAVGGSVSFGAVDPASGRVVALLANSAGSLDALGVRLLRAAG